MIRENNDFKIKYGFNQVIDAIHNKKNNINKIFIIKNFVNRKIYFIKKLSIKYNIPYQTVNKKKLNFFTKRNHEGVVCVVSKIIFHNIYNILPLLYDQGKTPLLLILNNIFDVRNFGSILRTSFFLGVHAIVVPTQNSCFINYDSIKTSSGAIFNIPICREKNLQNTILFLKHSGVKIFSATEKSTNNIYKQKFKDPLAIIIGNENKGISQNLILHSNYNFKIPSRRNIKNLKNINSLNVAVACGIILYEIIKQRA